MKLLLILLSLVFIQGCFEDKPRKYERLVFDGELEPAQPLKDVFKTVRGIDVNNNGVEDALERWVNRDFSTQNKRNAAKQLIRYKTLVLLTVKDKDKNIAYIHKVNDSRNCLRSFNLTYEEKESFAILHRMVVRNEEREVLSELSDMNFGGQVTMLSNPYSRGRQFCEFKIVK